MAVVIRPGGLGTPIDCGPNGATIKNSGPAVAYYRDEYPVSATTNDGQVAVNGSVAVGSGTQWFFTTGGSATLEVIETQTSSSGYSPPEGGIPRADLSQDVQDALAKDFTINGRTVTLGSIGSGQSVSLLSTDDRGQVDIYGTLSASSGVLTIDSLSAVSRCTFRIVVTQDATGNRAFQIKNGTGASQTINVEQAPNAETFIYGWTPNGSDLHIADPSAPVQDTGFGTPTVSGTNAVGQTLTAAAPPNVLSPSYQWFRDSSAISGETAATHTLVNGDIGHVITCRVAGTPFAFTAPVVPPSPDIVYVGTASVSTSVAANTIVQKPTGVLATDVMVAAIETINGQTYDHTAVPAGWTLVGRYTNSSANSVTLVYWKREGEVNSDAGPFTFTGNASVTYRSRTVAFRNAGLGGGTPYELLTNSTAAFGSSVTLPTKTPVSTGRMYVGLVTMPQTVAITWADGTLTDVSSADYVKFQYKFLGASTSATGTFSGTLSPSQSKTVVSLLLKP